MSANIRHKAQKNDAYKRLEKLALKSFANYLAQHRRRKPAPVPEDYIAGFIEGLEAGKAMRGNE